MYERLRGSDYRFLAVCLALLAATTWYSARNFYRAFPEASIDFRVDRSAAQTLAARFLTEHGYRTEGYRQASSFSFDNTAKTFLEREAGLERANRLMASRVRLWRWSHRWFRPQQKEEFRADITPAGELAGFSHVVPEDAARPGVSTGEARAGAEDFLITRMRRDPAGLDFVEVSEAVRPRRTDRVFTWKEPDFNLRDSTYRLEVTMLGNEVGGYREYLKVPDQWRRDYARLRSKNEVASTVDSAVMVLLMVGLVAVIVVRVRRHDLHWRGAAWVGIVGMALAFCAQLNQLPLEEFGYPTTDSYGSFMARQLLQAVIAALGAGGLLFVLALGAEPLYRGALPEKVAFYNLFSLRGLRTKRFLLGSVLGITLTGIFVAYQTGFYILASRLGAWSPADVPYDDLLNTRFPWMFVLFGGFLPAVSEELLFRMFAIPFLRKLIRSLAVAIVAAGFIWGFGHAAYPQQPFYIRGVEVGIGGVALGLVMLRWGILPALVWHYSVDAMYSAMLLLRSESLYYRLSGAASAGIILLPVVAALVAYWRKGGFAPETGLLNRDQAAPEEPLAEPEHAPEPVPFQPEMPGPRTRRAALAVFAAGLLGLMVPVSRFGDKPDYRIGEDQARAAAAAFLRSQGLDPAPFRSVTYPDNHWRGDDSLAGKYFLERLPVPAASALFERNRPVQHWVTRFYRSLDREEMLVSLHPETGRVLGFRHTVPEDRPGADISPEAARQTVLEFARARGLDLASMDLKESRSEKQKARRDHTLAWESHPGDPRAAGDARYRLEFVVAGDRVASWRGFWKLPEAYARARSRQNFISLTVTTLRLGVLSSLVVFALWMLLQQIRRGRVPWKTVIRIAVPAAILSALGALLALRVLPREYNTAIPFETFVAVGYLGVGTSAVAGFLILGAVAALLLSFYPESLAALRAGRRRLLAPGAAVALAAAIGLGLLAARLSAWLASRFHAQALFSVSSPDLLVYHAPALAALAEAFRSALLLAGLVGILALAARVVASRWMLAPLAGLLAFAFLSGEIRTPGEFFLEYATTLITLGAAAILCLVFARRNYLAYAVVFWLVALRDPIAALLGSPHPAYRLQGWILLGVAVGGVLWAVLPALWRRPEPRPASA